MRVFAKPFAALLVATALLAGCARPLPEGVTELTYATPYPPSHPFSLADQRWMDFVERESGGTLIIRPVWSGSLLSADMSMEELRHGVADIGLITPIYVRGGTHLLRTQTGFYSGADSIESQTALYRCMAASIPQFGEELKGLEVLAVQGGLLPGIVTRGRQITSLNDLKGLRIRAPTELLGVLSELGVDPVNMPMGEVYSAMAKGVIDGVIAPPDTLRALHLTEVAGYFYELKVPRGAYPARAMGKQRWNSLSAQQRALLERSKPVWEAALADEIRQSEQIGREAGEGIITWSPASAADQQHFDELYLRDGQANARDLERFGIDGIEAYRVARNSIAARDEVRCEGDDT
ncbi:TRAP transporter substrate-binding protein DctP [Altericroceibacterium endophyticum]|uniref:ABC transporter substrate-binding protein n=1 Tax=Altericroceibacterium endophyticum TaxID=1808508 RepID=A0A6I4T7T0_9SPHN|nr:TRAP transporter substrate-binding protein DctP [Altericroceibacterium endophyticum]MXO66748.1 ABC transporter substrate-binding protein [Altericroceibacterium endophyticum]